MLGNGLLFGLLIILSAIGGAQKYSYPPAVLTTMEQQRKDFFRIQEQNQLQLEKTLAFAREKPEIQAKRQADCARLYALLKKRTIRIKK